MYNVKPVYLFWTNVSLNVTAGTAGPGKVCSVASYTLLGPTDSVVTNTVGKFVTLFWIGVQFDIDLVEITHHRQIGHQS